MRCRRSSAITPIAARAAPVLMSPLRHDRWPCRWPCRRGSRRSPRRPALLDEDAAVVRDAEPGEEHTQPACRSPRRSLPDGSSARARRGRRTSRPAPRRAAIRSGWPTPRARPAVTPITHATSMNMPCVEVVAPPHVRGEDPTVRREREHLVDQHVRADPAEPARLVGGSGGPSPRCTSRGGG